MSEAAIERARTLVGIHRREEAIPLLFDVLATEPENVEALIVLASAQLTSEPRASLETARRALALDPNEIRGHLLGAIACLELNRASDAVGHARAAVAEAPWLAQAHVALSHSLARKRRARDEAMRAAEQAIELEPNDAAGYNAAGVVELARARWKRAEKWFEKALEVDPQYVTAQVNLVTAREAGGHLGSALSDAGSILRIDPRDDDARDVLKATVYTTLVHLMWIAIVVFYLVAVARGVS